MKESAPSADHRSNPFATRYTRPGVILPLDAAGAPRDLEALLDRLASLGGSGSIEGPHGHGKTTTLLALAGAAACRGSVVQVQRVRSFRDLPDVVRSLVRLPSGGTLFIDGWESLGWGGCRAIRLLSRVRSRHLVVTSHGASGLPVLLSCRTSPGLLASLLAYVPESGPAIDAQDVRDAFDRHGGNLRESLYDLYDRFERRARPVAGD